MQGHTPTQHQKALLSPSNCLLCATPDYKPSASRTLKLACCQGHQLITPFPLPIITTFIQKLKSADEKDVPRIY